MKDLFADLVLYLGLAAGLISALNFLLPSSAKTKLKSCLETVWIWLEYKRLLNFYRVTLGFEYIIPLSVIVSLAFGYLIDYTSESDIHQIDRVKIPYIVAPAIFTNTLTFFLFPKFRDAYIKNRNYIFSTDNLSDVIHRSIGYNFKPIICVPLMLSKIPELGGVILLFFVFFGYPFIALNGLWLTLAFWAALVSILKGLLSLFNFFILKVVSYPAGPMLFISALLSSLVSFLKFFT